MMRMSRPAHRRAVVVPVLDLSDDQTRQRIRTLLELQHHLTVKLTWWTSYLSGTRGTSSFRSALIALRAD